MATSDKADLFNRAIGQWLKTARIDKGLSADQAAAEANLSQQQLEEIEGGDQSVVGSDFYALVALYEISTESVNEFLESYGLQAASV